MLQDFCSVLSKLHDKAPVHKWEASKAAIVTVSHTALLQCVIQPYYGVSYGLVTVLQDFCRVLSELHDKAPVHKWEASKAAIEKAFGLPVEHMFESIDHSAIASGSIAQVQPPHLPPPPPPGLLLCPEPDFVDKKFRLAWCGLCHLEASATLTVLFAILHMYNHTFWGPPRPIVHTIADF